ncbi:type II secretion system F family protein [Candidatus Microgenomates bacterium]|nr:type II secretion system F family protein [Candidatus Microgenomates bacterium]
MLAAGISIVDIVDSLLEDAKGDQKILIETMKDDINQGHRLNETFAKFPQVFDKVTVNIVKAAEEAGTLDVTLKDLKATIKRDQEFTDKVRSAFVYPLLIMGVFGGVMLVILTFVVPRISKVFMRMNATLPLPTKVLMFLSEVLLTYTIPLIVGLIAAGVGFYFLYKSKKRMIFNMLFSLPLVSQLVRQIDLTRFTRSMFLLLTSGIPIVTALDLSEEVVLKNDVRKSIKRARDVVFSGRPLSQAFKEEKKTIPTMMTRIAEAGERSGGLDKAMSDISEYLDYEVGKTLASVIVVIEPLMLVIVGVLIGGMMLAIIAPIYGLIGSVGR